LQNNSRNLLNSLQSSRSLAPNSPEDKAAWANLVQNQDLEVLLRWLAWRKEESLELPDPQTPNWQQIALCKQGELKLIEDIAATLKSYYPK
jgi:hypothetical protein